MHVTHFTSAAGFRIWLKKNHAIENELLVGFFRKDSGLGGLTYAEALDEALCVGWIDGVRRKIDDESFSIRFTPRRVGSIWSLINVRHVERLMASGRMLAPGLKVFATRRADRTGIYSFEKPVQVFDAVQDKQFRTAKKAWIFWQAQPPGYRRIATNWVVSAKQEETRQRRLMQLITDSANGLRLEHIVGKKSNAKL